MSRNVPYEDGTWFAVPLRDGGYGTGIVARHSADGCILIYLFGPRYKNIPPLHEVQKKRSKDAIKVKIAGDLGLIEGSWPIIGSSEAWKRDEWPMPKFIRKDEISNSVWLVTYADDNPNQVICEERASIDLQGFERDSLSGAGAIEIVLTRLLA